MTKPDQRNHSFKLGFLWSGFFPYGFLPYGMRFLSYGFCHYFDSMASGKTRPVFSLLILPFLKIWPNFWPFDLIFISHFYSCSCPQALQNETSHDFLRWIVSEIWFRGLNRNVGQCGSPRCICLDLCIYIFWIYVYINPIMYIIERYFYINLPN